MTKVKICGLTNYEDALAAADAGADMLGLNFYKKSPRYVAPEAAQIICDRLRADLDTNCPLLIGLFVNDGVSHVSNIMNKVGLDYAQLSGDESAEILAELRKLAYKAIRPANESQALDDVQYYSPQFTQDERIPSLLLDAYNPKLYGGTGEQVALEIAQAVKPNVPRLMLAGGLNPDNVAQVVNAVQPWAVDVASGVEIPDQPGRKDFARVKAFMQAARGLR